MLQMADESDQKHMEGPLVAQPWPGYWRTREKIARARRFQDLIRHKERWGTDIDRAAPIEELIPGVDKNEAMLRLDEEIEKLQHLVFWDLSQYTGARTRVLWRDPYGVNDEKEESYDLILDYFRLPRPAGKEHKAFEAVMQCLNNGIGVLEARKKRAFWEMFNPLFWIAWFIRLPITVMERAGFGRNPKSQEMMAAGYVRFVKIAMGVILLFVCLKLGIEVPWKELLKRLTGWVFS